ncbi:transcriptional regulator/sugar kinase [Caulobacter sp. AP07]|uniref:ROK family protein n=1 Tax=Caulobacter sp. AP07 TaxID=1144304 RepID=UPI0002720BB2|nr:ROK family protein [Caulobacter sp. AP07]EJL36944.1 transcriptional regulator/sugar kinase [Caulobacter sp. AP07]
MSDRMLLGGVEAGGTKFLCGVANEDGVILDQVRIPTTTPDETLGAASAFFDQAAATHGPLSALSIGSFGPLSLRQTSADYGSITSTPKVGWSDIDLLGHFRRRLDVPMALDTDVNCAAVGELLFGSGRGLDTFCYVTIGTGIGVGLLIGGVPHGGANHPEAGHIRLPRAVGDQAFEGICPFHGDCLEGLACGPAMLARWGVPAEELPAHHPAWAIEADYIAGLCATLTYIVRPDRIIIGGGVMQQANMYAHVRRTLTDKLADYDASVRGLDMSVYVAEPTAGASAGLTGALAIAHRTITRQWPMHWAIGAQQNSVSTLAKVS